MQNKNTQKIIIDKVKLKTLQRLNCPEEVIIQKIIYNNFIPQGDELIDLLLESLTDEKTFSNWGGSRDNAGRKSSKNNNINQDEKIKLIKSSCNNQLVDKDKDIDKDKENNKEIYKENFEEWWSYYPKLRAGSKKKAYVKYKQAIIEDKLTPEFLLSKVKEYAESDEVKKGFACGAEVYFNKCKYNNQYNTGSDMDYLEKSLRELGL